MNSGLRNDTVALKWIIMDNGKPVSATADKTVTGAMIDAYAAVLVTADNALPRGTMLINDGAKRTRKATVTLTISASDNEGGSGVKAMHLSNDGTNWSEWEPYVTGKPWILASGRGTKTVYVEFRDGAGSVSEVASDAIHRIHKR